jgi:glycosyltransferase involved in cell wall biosynthesis
MSETTRLNDTNTPVGFTAGLVSTVIPTFNRRALVCESIDSALAQTYERQEIIVIDDGSTDGTAQLLSERYGNRIRYQSQANAGVSSARNRGIELAAGEFIAFLDSDDSWEQDKLARQVALLRARQDLGMVLTDVRRIDSHGQPIDVLRRRRVIPYDGNVLVYLLRDPTFVPSSALLRRTTVDALGGFDTSLHTAEDIEFHLRIATRFGIGLIDEPLTTSIRNHGGLSNATGSDADYVRVIERFVATSHEQLSVADRRSCLFEAYVRSARSAIVSRRLRNGARHYAKAIASVSSASDAVKLMQLATVLSRTLAVDLFRALGFRRAAESSSA